MQELLSKRVELRSDETFAVRALAVSKLVAMRRAQVDALMTVPVDKRLQRKLLALLVSVNLIARFETHLIKSSSMIFKAFNAPDASSLNRIRGISQISKSSFLSSCLFIYFYNIVPLAAPKDRASIWLMHDSA